METSSGGNGRDSDRARLMARAGNDHSSNFGRAQARPPRESGRTIANGPGGARREDLLAKRGLGPGWKSDFGRTENRSEISRVALSWPNRGTRARKSHGEFPMIPCADQGKAGKDP